MVNFITQEHIDADRNSEHLFKKIGSTGSGCGPANSDRVLRKSVLARDVPELEDYLLDVATTTNEAIDAGEGVFIEGSQGFALSLYYGSFPYVTSKDTCASTFAADGNVGEIDGVKYKIAGAVKNNMDVVLVSPYNYDEAIKVVNENKYDIEIIKVSTLKEAINYLNS